MALKPLKAGMSEFPSTSGGSIPSGGSTGQALVKASAADGDVTWATVSGASVADGTYTIGLGVTTNGTITITGGVITAIQQAT